MDEGFEIPVTYRNESLLFPARLIQYGYTHKFEVTVNDTLVFFERDDEGSYRALGDPENMDTDKHIDVHLLKAIAASIEDILK